MFSSRGLTNIRLTSVCSPWPHKHQAYLCMFSMASQTSGLPLYVLHGLTNISLTSVCSPWPHKHQSYLCMFSRASQTPVLPLYVLEGLGDHCEGLPHVVSEVGLEEGQTEVPLGDTPRLYHPWWGDSHGIGQSFITLLDGCQSHLQAQSAGITGCNYI